MQFSSGNDAFSSFIQGQNRTAVFNPYNFASFCDWISYIGNIAVLVDFLKIQPYLPLCLEQLSSQTLIPILMHGKY